jgi:hypothetical protein
MTQPSRFAGPRELFERQIRFIQDDDRESQLDLYAVDCVWEFPFASPDRPRRMVGREEIRRVMTPLWQQARQAGAHVTGFSALAIHETAEPEVIVAEFELQVAVPATGKSHRLSFVQVLRARGGKIAELREYFNTQARATLLEDKAS